MPGLASCKRVTEGKKKKYKSLTDVRLCQRKKIVWSFLRAASFQLRFAEIAESLPRDAATRSDAQSRQRIERKNETETARACSASRAKVNSAADSAIYHGESLLGFSSGESGVGNGERGSDPKPDDFDCPPSFSPHFYILHLFISSPSKIRGTRVKTLGGERRPERCKNNHILSSLAGFLAGWTDWLVCRAAARCFLAFVLFSESPAALSFSSLANVFRRWKLWSGPG